MQPKKGPAFVSPFHPLGEIGLKTVIYYLPSGEQSFDCQSREQTWFTTLLTALIYKATSVRQSNLQEHKTWSDLIWAWDGHQKSLVTIIFSMFYSICVNLSESGYF